jgi:hypothetical protein
MLQLKRQFRFAARTVPVCLMLGAAVAACSGGVSTTPTGTGPTTALASGGSATPTPAPTATPTAAPTSSPTAAAIAACSNQATGAASASVTQTLATAGGLLCIPAFGGFGGTIAYPPVTTSVSIALTSSTTNTGSYPSLGSATPIFYLGISIGGATAFGTGSSGGGLLATSTTIIPGQVYTVFGAATLFGISRAFSPCQTTATAGSGGNGVIAGLGTVLNSVTVPTATTGVLEIEPGATAGAGAC